MNVICFDPSIKVFLPTHFPPTKMSIINNNSKSSAHPLLKIVFIQRVLKFVRVDFESGATLSRFFSLVIVNTAWFETISEYGGGTNHIRLGMNNTV